MESKKILIYQVFTRLFGNTVTRNKPWGTLEENGVGKFSSFTPKALSEIRSMGFSHIWFTGVLHHALVRDYSAFGISHDHPDVVKGRAGSPYAIKDYYNVNPDLAEDPAHRLEEFRDLVKHTHEAGLKVIIDIVPNHVARNYKSVSNPPGITDFGASDNTSRVYHRDNNFYYTPGEAFRKPQWKNGYLPLGGETHRFTGSEYQEFPARWTGNNSRSPQPDMYDWYETAKLNYGVREDGQKDFDSLPDDYRWKTAEEHYHFWINREVPDTWKKMRDIGRYWLEMGVDGFRYDMAEMVPVEFWSYMNSFLKKIDPSILLLAEVYDPNLYRDYLRLGKMDFLYDKVDLYDTLKGIIRDRNSTESILHVRNRLADIAPCMMQFLENHDEHRIASPEFAGDPVKAKPALVLSALVGSSPLMIYFGQETGEKAAESAGFGSPGRTSIFDYIGVPSHQRWVNHGAFDGGLLLPDEKELRDFYCRLLNFVSNNHAVMGDYRELHSFNLHFTEYYNNHVFSFSRFRDSEILIIVINFHPSDTFGFNLGIPPEVTGLWNLKKDDYVLTDQIYGKEKGRIHLCQGTGRFRVDIKPLQSFIFRLENDY